MTQHEKEIELLFDHLFCIAHAEPFRAAYPAGTGIALAHSLALIADHSVSPDVITLREDLNLLAKMLNRRPLCCRLLPSELIDLYVEALGPLYGEKECDVCKEVAYGAPFSYTHHQSILEVIGHLCFECVLHRFQPNHFN